MERLARETPLHPGLLRAHIWKIVEVLFRPIGHRWTDSDRR
jgi:hypothetical protein